MLDKSNFTAVCFDLFHTLVDVAAAPGASGRYTADILGLSRAAWNAACFSDAHNITAPCDHLSVVRTLAHSLDPAIPMALIEEATLERQQRFDHALLQVEAEVIDTLRVLRAGGLRLGLISNASSGEVSAWARSPLAALFDTVVFSCECGYRKPQADIYPLAMDRLGVAAGATLFVGDGGSDEHTGARALGIRTVLLTRHLGEMDAERLAGRRAQADVEITCLSELLRLL